jgi:hypothetical protein
MANAVRAINGKAHFGGIVQLFHHCLPVLFAAFAAEIATGSSGSDVLLIWTTSRAAWFSEASGLWGYTRGCH